MDFKTYQKKARETALYPDLGSNFIYPTLGLVGEAGEVAEKVKKVIRDKNGIFDEASKSAIKKETDTCSFHGLLLYHCNCTIGKFILPSCRSVRL